LTAPPTDRELVELLGNGREAFVISRRPYRYATSAPLEELQVKIGGSELAMIFKDLSRERLIGDARVTKPAFLYEPAREIETYARILAPARLGPSLVAAVTQADPPRHWLLLEKVPGVELWQVGELAVWEAVAAWLGGFHAKFAPHLDEVANANPHLLEYGREWFRSWCERAQTALAAMSDRRASLLVRALERYDEVISALAALPRTLVHGELYPSNVLVVPAERPVRVCPVDWEMAGIGPGLLDLAALVSGWGHPERDRLARAYLHGLGEREFASRFETLPVELGSCRLHLALQWLGWSTDWRPPPEHAHDWLGEALQLTEELGLA
jgi:hypothetical protein